MAHPHSYSEQHFITAITTFLHDFHQLQELGTRFGFAFSICHELLSQADRGKQLSCSNVWKKFSFLTKTQSH